LPRCPKASGALGARERVRAAVDPCRAPQKEEEKKEGVDWGPLVNEAPAELPRQHARPGGAAKPPLSSDPTYSALPGKRRSQRRTRSGLQVGGRPLRRLPALPGILSSGPLAGSSPGRSCFSRSGVTLSRGRPGRGGKGCRGSETATPDTTQSRRPLFLSSFLIPASCRTLQGPHREPLCRNRRESREDFHRTNRPREPSAAPVAKKESSHLGTHGRVLAGVG